MMVLRRIAPVLIAIILFYAVAFALGRVLPESWEVFVAWIPFLLSILAWSILIAVHRQRAKDAAGARKPSVPPHGERE